MKKLLILGSDYGTLDVALDAKKNDIYVIVTDLMKTSPTKQVADEAWLISTTDLDTLEKKCREEEVNGIMFGASDFNIEQGRELCARLGLPIYCDNDYAWKVATNKAEFKKVCKKVGVPIATDYYLTDALSEAELKDIEYPVVVKPVDKSGNRGMSYCNNQEELITAYKFARSISDNPTIVVERQLHGMVFAVDYLLAEGEASLLYFCAEPHQPGQLDNIYSLMYTQPADLKQYIEEVNEKVKEVIKESGCREGLVWIECMLDDDGHFYLLEMGYRFGGEMIYGLYDKVSGINSVRWMTEVALGVKHKKEDLPADLNQAYESCVGSYFLFSTKDGKIGKYEGLEEIEKIPNVIVDCPKRNGGGIARYHASLGIIRFFAHNVNELCEIMARINALLRIEDENGEQMYVVYDNFDFLRDQFARGIKEFNS